MIRFLKNWMSSISSDLYEEILKLNKSHTNRIIQVILCNTDLIQLEKDCIEEFIKEKDL